MPASVALPNQAQLECPGEDFVKTTRTDLCAILQLRLGPPLHRLPVNEQCLEKQASSYRPKGPVRQTEFAGAASSHPTHYLEFFSNCHLKP
jgi:hypothetical protein